MAELWTILKVLGWTQQRFSERGLGTPRLDAEVLLGHVLGRDRVWLYMHYDQPLGSDELTAYRELIKRRLGGEPVAYLIGQREFRSLTLRVDARVLVPRPDTETLVEVGLAVLERLAVAAPRVVDVGVGSGAVALAVKSAVPGAEVVAIDRSPGAVEVARANAAALALDVEVREGDLLGPVSGEAPFHLILSNPPYIPTGELAGLPREVLQEPRLALDGGGDGLELYRRLVPAAHGQLVEGGALAVEVGAGQAGAVAELFRRAGFVGVEVTPDLAGIGRVVSGARQRSSEPEA